MNSSIPCCVRTYFTSTLTSRSFRLLLHSFARSFYVALYPGVTHSSSPSFFLGGSPFTSLSTVLSLSLSLSFLSLSLSIYLSLSFSFALIPISDTARSRNNSSVDGIIFPENLHHSLPKLLLPTGMNKYATGEM